MHCEQPVYPTQVHLINHLGVLCLYSSVEHQFAQEGVGIGCNGPGGGTGGGAGDCNEVAWLDTHSPCEQPKNSPHAFSSLRRTFSTMNLASCLACLLELKYTLKLSDIQLTVVVYATEKQEKHSFKRTQS